MTKQVLSAVEALLRRTLLLNFKLEPPPSSITQSLAVHSHIGAMLGGNGRIMHYNQKMCPVTKQRLEGLRVLVEDLGRKEEAALDIFGPGVRSMAPEELTPLEKDLLALRTPETIEEGPAAGITLRLASATRDRQKIKQLKHVQVD